MANNLWDSYKKMWNIVFYLSLTAVLIIVGSVISSTFFSNKEPKSEIEIEESPIVIDSIMPKDDLYVGTALIEDYVTEKKIEKIPIIKNEEHICVQIVKQKCSFKINLGKVEYELLNDSVVSVKMPDLEYTATTQDSPFLSDDEEFWKEELQSTNELKQRVAKQIEARFNSKENRRKSMLYAEEAIQELLRKLGYKAEFVHHLEQDRKQ